MDQCYIALDRISQSEKRILARIYQSPQARPLSWADVLALFTSIGAAHQARNGDVVLVLGGQVQAFHAKAALNLDLDNIAALQRFLHRCRWQAYAQAASVDYVLALDGLGARIHPLLAFDSAESRHLIHDLAHDQPDFFPEILAALEGDGHVVVISADSRALFDYLALQPTEIAARFQITVDTDMSAAGLPQCLAVARDALAEHAFSQKMTAP